MSKKIQTFEDVAGWQLCCGCGACAAVCPDKIEMIDVLEYGRRPRFRAGTDAEIPQGAMTVCPGIGLTRLVKPEGQLGDQHFFDAWGPVLGVWEGYAADPQIRFEGSSGGVATALALFGIECLGMHGALHIRSRKHKPYLNETVLSTNRDELLKGAGSRYAPASPCDSLELIGRADRPCIFIGKPCDVAAVHTVAQLRSSLKDKVGFSLAFFCAGTPSTAGTMKMLQRMGIEDINSLKSLRYRGCGWPGNAVVEYSGQDGTNQQKKLTYEQSWGEILQKYRQWRCYICPDHIGEFADIAVADAWHRDVTSHQPGLSILIARSYRGLNIIQQAQRQGYLHLDIADPSLLGQCMPWQTSLKGHLWARIQSLKMMKTPVPEYQGFKLFDFWRSELSIKEKIYSFLSTIKRVFAKKLNRRHIMCSMQDILGLHTEQSIEKE